MKISEKLIRKYIKNILKEVKFNQSDAKSGKDYDTDMTPEDREAAQIGPAQSDLPSGRSTRDYKTPEDRQSELEFTIETDSHKITFLSVPHKPAASMASELYKGLGKKKETSVKGREWIKNNIYAAIEKRKFMQDYWAKKLGVKKVDADPKKGIKKVTGESHWSSWTFGVCYKSDSLYVEMMNSFEPRKPSLAFYPAGASKLNLANIKKNPESFLNEEIYCLFKPEEAPIEVGDGLFFSRHSGQKTYKSIPVKKYQSKPSHMRVLVSDSGIAIGGNESSTIKRSGHNISNKNAKNAKYNNNKCLGVFKKVKITKVEEIPNYSLTN